MQFVLGRFAAIGAPSARVAKIGQEAPLGLGHGMKLTFLPSGSLLSNPTGHFRHGSSSSARFLGKRRRPILSCRERCGLARSVPSATPDIVLPNVRQWPAGHV